MRSWRGKQAPLDIARSRSWQMIKVDRCDASFCIIEVKSDAKEWML